MKAELLSMLCAKSMNLEISSGSHDAITPEDIAHFLGTLNLKDEEYNFLMAKYTDSGQAREDLFEDIFVECAEMFIGYKKNKEIKTDVLLLRKFINLALSETIDATCPFCLGVGSVKTASGVDKCYHCNGTGQFIFDDNNRPAIMDIPKKTYLYFKRLYLDILDKIKGIEVNALSKIGDD